jgi:very-short-patch-repair endonuclease
MRRKSSPRERKLAELAVRQHGVVAARQLIAAGFTEEALRRRVEDERLYRVQPGVLSLTPTVLPRGCMLAAVLTFGRGAVLSHRAAAAIWDLGPWPTGLIDVTVPGRRKGRRGIRLHRADVERVIKDGFPVTTVARTLVDLAAVLPLGRLRDAFERAERLRLLDARKVSEEMHCRRGARKIRAILAEWQDPEPTKNEFEQALRTLCREYEIPLPSQNVVLLGYEVDAFWAPNLVVELDGWEWHRTRRSFEEDRRNAAALEAAGYRVLRFTWRQMRDERPALAAAIRSGCPRAAGRGRALPRAAARLTSAPSA